MTRLAQSTRGLDWRRMAVPSRIVTNARASAEGDRPCSRGCGGEATGSDTCERHRYWSRDLRPIPQALISVQSYSAAGASPWYSGDRNRTGS